MRIALVATASTPVREVGSDSIEHLVWLLSRELTALGHDVTVFAVAGSEPRGTLVVTLPGPYAVGGAPDDWHACEWVAVARAVARSGEFDVVHSHNYLWGMPLEPLARAPMLHTLHVTPYDDHVRLWTLHPDASVSAVSHAQWRGAPHLAPVATIHHGVDARHFPFEPSPDDYLCYLGRFTPGKGPLDAIAVARALGRRLVLAGPANEYFDHAVRPLVDGRLVEYVGAVSGGDRARLLGRAAALLYPVRDPEPFGLVLVEAMMCGTPVVASAIGAVPEIVDVGVTGFVGPDPAALAARVPDAVRLDRAAVRARAHDRFSSARMAAEYAAVYAALARRAAGRP